MSAQRGEREGGRETGLQKEFYTLCHPAALSGVSAELFCSFVF